MNEALLGRLGGGKSSGWRSRNPLQVRVASGQVGAVTTKPYQKWNMQN